jgi:hypothetical protein
MTQVLPGSVMSSQTDASAGARGLGTIARNFSTAAQVLTAATLTYLTGSKLKVPFGGLQVGTKLRWRFSMAKTAAGTATSTFAIVFGTAGTTADTARVSFTKPAGTAAADEAFVTVEATVRSVSATGVVVGNFTLIHGLENTGHAVIPAVVLVTTSAAFDNADEDLYVGLVATTGAADAITVHQMEAEMVGPS